MVVVAGAALATALSAPVTLFTAAAATLPQTGQCGAEEEENGIPVYPAKVNHKYVYPGEVVTVSAGCFTAGETVDIAFHSVAVQLGTTQADANGFATASVTLPNAPKLETCRSHSISMTGEATGHVASAQVFFGCIAAGEGSGGGPRVTHGPKTVPQPPQAPAPPVAEPTGVTTGPSLPFTGAETGPLSVTGVALLAAGGLLVLGARRRYVARHAVD
jgi:hypothetical protein